MRVAKLGDFQKSDTTEASAHDHWWNCQSFSYLPWVSLQGFHKFHKRSHPRVIIIGVGAQITMVMRSSEVAALENGRRAASLIQPTRPGMQALGTWLAALPALELREEMASGPISRAGVFQARIQCVTLTCKSSEVFGKLQPFAALWCVDASYAVRIARPTFGIILYSAIRDKTFFARAFIFTTPMMWIAIQPFPELADVKINVQESPK